MTHAELASSPVSRVGAASRIAATECRGHRRVRDRSLIPAVADALEFAVPGVDWRNPHLEPDVRVGRRSGGPFDTAEGRQTYPGLRARRQELTGRDRLR
jgi:hypothetical protein